MKQISFVTNTSVNTRDHAELLLRSLRDNLDGKEHEIMVFIDRDSEDLYEYLKTIKSKFHDLKIVTHRLKPCTGYALNNNLLVQLATHDIVSYLQSDMVIGPHYDTEILSQLEDNMILSATRVEPPLHGPSDKVVTMDFGVDPTQFDMNSWNSYSPTIKSDREDDFFFAPITFYKSVWERLGGYDTLFRRSREDSDLVQRAIKSGIRLKQTWRANVYHFTCTSSRGKDWFNRSNGEAQTRVQKQNLADQIELRKFIRKWGSFNHGTSILKKFDIDLITRNPISQNDIVAIYNMEPHFSRVWLETEELKTKLLESKRGENLMANDLFGFTKEDWKRARQFYNITDYDAIYKIGEPTRTQYNAAFIFDFDKWDIDAENIMNNLYNLHRIIENEGPGTYEFVGGILDINHVVDISTALKVNNPQFNMELLTIE